MTLRKLWKELTPERRRQIAGAFWRDTESTEQQLEAVAAISRQLNFRSKTVASLPLEKRVRYFASLINPSDALVLRALVTYHLHHHRPMMVAFLDAVGVPHEDGLIQQEITAPAAERLAEGAAALSAQYAAEDVALYLSTLLLQDPETWGGLGDRPELHAHSAGA